MLFPRAPLPLRLFETRYLDMAKRCLREEAPFGVCLIVEGREVWQMSGAPAVPASIGCLARIEQWDMPQLGVLNIVARGAERFRLVDRRVQRDGLAIGEIELLPEETEPGDASEKLATLLVALPLPLSLKQELLELPGARARLERLNRFLEDAAPA